MRFSIQDKFEIFSIFIKCNKNKRLAREEYMRLYPNRVPPSAQTFTNIYKQMQNRGTLMRKKRNYPANEDEELQTLLYFQGKIFS